MTASEVERSSHIEQRVPLLHTALAVCCMALQCSDIAVDAALVAVHLHGTGRLRVTRETRQPHPRQSGEQQRDDECGQSATMEHGARWKSGCRSV